MPTRRVVEIEKWNEGWRGLWRSICRDLNGNKFVVQDSSLATEPAMRINIDATYPDGSIVTGLHLDRAAARYLYQRLGHFLKTGSPRPKRMRV